MKLFLACLIIFDTIASITFSAANAFSSCISFVEKGFLKQKASQHFCLALLLILKVLYLFIFYFRSVLCLQHFFIFLLFHWLLHRVMFRCFAALGDVSTVHFLHHTNHLADKMSQDTVRIHPFHTKKCYYPTNTGLVSTSSFTIINLPLQSQLLINSYRAYIDKLFCSSLTIHMPLLLLP